MGFEEGEVVLCTVEKIEGTVVFVKIDGSDEEGTIIMSEIAAGRVKNIRDYVVPKKRIVCKILRITSNGINLSLRRVSQKEQKEILQKENLEKSYKSIIKTVTKDKFEEILKKIQSEENLVDLIEESRKDPKKLQKIVGKEYTERIVEILGKQKQKTAEVKKEFTLKTKEKNGIELIKKILENTNARYLGSGKYYIFQEDKDIKLADNKAKEILQKIEKQAKENNIEIAIKEK